MGPDTILSQLATLARRLDTSSNLSEKEKRDLVIMGSLFSKHGSDLSKIKSDAMAESQFSIYT